MKPLLATGRLLLGDVLLDVSAAGAYSPQGVCAPSERSKGGGQAAHYNHVIVIIIP